jgi:hypothetical protein
MDEQNSISPYKPNPSVAKAFDVDESMSDADLTFDLFKKLVLARRTQDFVFLAIGKMLKIVRDRKLYKHLDFENFSQFLASEEIDFSREKAYMYIRIYDLYVEKLQLNPDSVAKIGVVRLNLLAAEVKNMPREEAVERIEEAGSMRYNEFVREHKEKNNKDGKPSYYWSDEQNCWVVNYYEDTTQLKSLGRFSEAEGVKTNGKK